MEDQRPLWRLPPKLSNTESQEVGLIRYDQAGEYQVPTLAFIAYYLASQRCTQRLGTSSYTHILTFSEGKKILLPSLVLKSSLGMTVTFFMSGKVGKNDCFFYCLLMAFLTDIFELLRPFSQLSTDKIFMINYKYWKMARIIGDFCPFYTLFHTSFDV